MADTNLEELMRQYKEAHPELYPQQTPQNPEKLDMGFLQNIIENKGNPIGVPLRSEGQNAPFYSESDHPMSIGQPAKTELPPIQEVLAQKPQQTLTREPQQQAPIRQVSEEEALGGMLSKPQDPTNDIMFGKNDLSTVENLKKAQQARDSNQNSARMLRGAALAGEGLLGLRTHRITGPDKDPNRSVNVGANKLADDLEKNAGQPIQDLEQQVAMQKEDPNSAVSKGMRDLGKRFGVNIQGDMSAANMEKIVPWLAKAYEGEQGRENQKELSKQRGLDRNALMKIKGEERKEKNQSDFIYRASKQLAPIAKDYSTIRDAEKLAEGMDDKNPAAQLSVIYSIIKVLDKNSAVKEGEIKLATSIGNIPGTIDVVLSKISSNPQLLSEGVIRDLKSEIKRIAQIQRESYDLNRNMFVNQAKSEGVEHRMNEIDPYYDSDKSRGGKIEVSNGKESLMIDPSDLEHAAKDGYQQVK